MGHRIRSFLEGSAEQKHPVKTEVIAAIDGDACGTTPIHIEVAPLAVNVLVPPKVFDQSTKNRQQT